MAQLLEPWCLCLCLCYHTVVYQCLLCQPTNQQVQVPMTHASSSTCIYELEAASEIGYSHDCNKVWGPCHVLLSLCCIRRTSKREALNGHPSTVTLNWVCLLYHSPLCWWLDTRTLTDVSVVSETPVMSRVSSALPLPASSAASGTKDHRAEARILSRLTSQTRTSSCASPPHHLLPASNTATEGYDCDPRDRHVSHWPGCMV